MKCSYHPDKDAMARCSQCNKPLCDECAIPEGGKSFICSRCAALMAARDAVEGIDRRVEERESKKQEQEAKKKKKNKMWVVCQWVILAACIAVIAIQVPRVLSMFDEEKPIRQGTYATNENTDKCVRNLWRIARLLQEGKQPGTDLVCPETGSAYVVTTGETDIVVSCPNPGAHGFSAISVSRKHPVPRIVK